jgi:plastocyanin
MLMRTSFALLITLAACSDSNSGTPDAAVQTDGGGGGAATVMTVTCPATVPLTVTTTSASFVFTPTSTTIPVDSIVKFMMPADHNVAPYTTKPTDSGLAVDFGGTKCLKFTKAGMFSFLCTAHGFNATITVQ